MKTWEKQLQAHWDLSVELSPLNGEFDLNHYLVKVMRPGCDPRFVDMQCRALAHIRKDNKSLLVPEVVVSKSGLEVESLEDEQGAQRLVWVLTFLDGIVYADFRPKSIQLTEQLGYEFGLLHLALASFNHPYLERDFKWNLVQAQWISNKLGHITNASRRQLLESTIKEFKEIQARLSMLPCVAIHNDLNDYNLIVTPSLSPEPATGIIDFGDMCMAPRICDIAIAAAYLVLDHESPELALAALIKGYHRKSPLTENELDLFFPLLRMRLAVSVVNSTIEALHKPDDPYVVISQAPAWRFLESDSINAHLLCCRLRVVCGFAPTRSASRIMAFINAQRPK